MDYQGSEPTPIYKWTVSDTLHGYDSVMISETGKSNYELTTSNRFWYVFDNDGDYQIRVETPDGVLSKVVNVWKAKSYCFPIYLDECHGEVRNGDFETYSQLPDCAGQIDRACYWHTARAINIHNNLNTVIIHDGSFDYWHTGYVPYDTDICEDMSPPYGLRAWEGMHIAGTNAYAGFLTYFRNWGSLAWQNALQGYYREYMQQELEEPLLPGKTYTLSFWVSLGEISNLTTDFHVAFTSSLPKYDYQYVYSGVTDYTDRTLEIPTQQEGQLLTFTPNASFNGWTQVTTTFTYTGQYPAYYITLGNFKDNLSCNAQPISTGPVSSAYADFYIDYTGCYYLIDDINVVYENDPCCDDNRTTIDGRVSPQYISYHTISSGQKLLLEDSSY